MKHLNFLVLLALLFSVAHGQPRSKHGTTHFKPKAGPPNLVFILADDQGVGDVSHTGGLAATPHIDRLAEEGMRFTDAHTTSSVCTPTRYSILTGRYNWRSPLKKSVTWGLSEPLIPEDRMTVASMLKAQGYRTGIVGKWHLGLGWHKLPDGAKRKATEGPTKGDGWDVDYHRQVSGGPLALGFDTSFIIPASLDMYPYVYLRDDKPTEIPTVSKKWVRPGPAGKDFEAINCLRDFAREARSFISGHVENHADQPFFLYLPLTSPHTPIVPSEHWQGQSAIGPYGDFVMETDWVVGQVLAELDRLRIADNTLVIFTTDNGCSPAAKIPQLIAKGHYPNGNLRGHKADIFEGGHRVPFIVRWPDEVKKGSQCHQTICSVDYMATVAELIGFKLPDNAGEDSYSLVPLLEDADHAKPIRPYTIHHSIAGSFAIRQGDWKLALCPGSGGWSDPKPNKAYTKKDLPVVQLYNLKQDLLESTNLVAQHPDKADALAALLAKAIRDGRSTPGEPQENDGWPNTIHPKVLEAYPVLRQPK
ncbi:MAG: arylsulfatase [Akkermansiaceae bacterium]|nr:arylsulfatase [Akkermansiaceae bacterium]